MINFKAVKLFGLLCFAFCLSFQVKAKADYMAPPQIPESEKVKFDGWLRSAEKKTKDVVFSDAQGMHLNALVDSTSPYLRQHAKNPINWKPWRSNILMEARRNNKLIFLSIGYSTCHWCHVMKKESFSDVGVAKEINGSYVAIKVDREELPQIDSYYASVLEAVTGSAGWPITAIINSEGLPIYISSYLSKDKLVTLLGRVNSAWKNNPEFLLSTAKTMANMVTVEESSGDDKNDIDSYELLSDSKKKILSELDHKSGGIKGNVKFPQESLLLYMLDELRRAKSPEFERLLVLQLNNMMKGGIRDHVSGGFHRYSTDSKWMIPHYEKMLYNQALMSQVYLEAWQLFYRNSYLFVAKQTLDFSIEELYREGKGFYSALDADFNGQEGGYYLWPEAELVDVLKVQGITSYLFTPKDIKQGVKSGILVDESKRNSKVSDVLNKMSEQRHNRGVLHRDDKIITSWNGLMIYSLAAASVELGDNKYLNIATNVGDFLWDSRFDSKTGRLFRTSDRSQELFSLEDYAYLGRGFIRLYDATQDQKWLERARIIFQSATVESTLSGGGSLAALGVNTLSSLLDGELISPIIILQEVGLALEQRILQAELFNSNKKSVAQIKSQISESPINRFSSLLYINNEVNGSSGDIRYFGKGAGRLDITCTEVVETKCFSIELQFSLKPGWHINSTKPLQDYLAPTIIQSSAELMVDYPEHSILKLGFQDEPLSLFEGDFKISISKVPAKAVERVMIKLPLQACNDRMCLFPEESFIVF
ncbi:thioredoxin domain-containing protein [Gilvimarinus sp. 1_MG-2023]|uniref:thioredoxin domain-containing protein n=1 Tax=Gilvimarinus sp. 1_MG-2023 TaxID=3062638 RepID=UPI0026E13899|nr:DUF255 domain-containing protein [Gilvimarinus sp. 1_MG-2023]MDO6748362.1 DUF255 domain-containing protein [Gilvimarinus sp. 1_MG-2023]